MFTRVLLENAYGLYGQTRTKRDDAHKTRQTGKYCLMNITEHIPPWFFTSIFRPCFFNGSKLFGTNSHPLNIYISCGKSTESIFQKMPAKAVYLLNFVECVMIL